MNLRDAMYYIMTGETFDGKKAAADGARQRSRAEKRSCASARAELAKVLLAKNRTCCAPASRRCAAVQGMAWEISDDYLDGEGPRRRDSSIGEQGRSQGLKQFLDEKSFRPGLGPYAPATAGPP